MKTKKIIFTFACVMLLLVGCSYDAGEEHAGASDIISMGEIGETAEENNDMSNEVTGETEEPVPEKLHFEQNDAYKLFYGTWEITQIVSKHGQLGGDEGCEDILGMQVTYLSDRYEFGGIVTVDHPNYLMSIYPRGSSLIGGLRQNDVGEDTLKLPDNEVFVWVQIVDKPIGVEDGMSYGFEPYVGSEFFIKDDNTLYCFDYDCFYEMKRVSYDEVSEEVVESVPNHHYEQNSAYKLFYGTWEITDIVSESRYLGGDEGCEDILGMQVTYLPDQYEFGESVTVEDPNYLISIFPTDSRFLFDQRQVSMDTLLPESDYFVWVQIADTSAASGYDDGRDYGFEPYVGSEFLIKDDNTLYLFANHCVYEMTRVSYIDGYDPRSALGYRERW